VTPVSHIEVPGELAIRSNHAAARECEQFVVGGGESELSALVKTLAEDLLPVEDSAWLLATPRNVLQLTEAEWYKLVSAVVKYRPGDRRVADFEKDWRVLRRYVKTVMLTVDRPYLDHIALCTNEDYSSIFSCLPLEVNEIGGDVTEIKYYEGSPGERIVGTAATPDDARQVATVDGAQPQS
jgi:hypothetical protein